MAHQCQSCFTLADCNLHVSHLKNKHIRNCHLPTHCCHAYLSIKAQLSLLGIEPSCSSSHLPVRASQSSAELGGFAASSMWSVFAFGGSFDIWATFQLLHRVMTSAGQSLRGNRSLLSPSWGECRDLSMQGRPLWELKTRVCDWQVLLKGPAWISIPSLSGLSLVAGSAKGLTFEGFKRDDKEL